jgi:spore coat protein A, manganese oxidase
VPFVPHLHGAHVPEESDGYPEAWFLPVARDIPRGYARVGSWYDRFRDQARQRTGVHWPEGGAVFDYPNDQRAGTQWYHSHELGLTRLNIYAGLAGALRPAGPVRLALPHPRPRGQRDDAAVPGGPLIYR